MLEAIWSFASEIVFIPNLVWILLTSLFLHQVIVGSEEGPLQLWNISTKKKLYDFNGWNSPVRCCVSSPALDVVAVGCSDGSVHVHNVRYDEELMSFNHQIRGAVTALSFRTGDVVIYCKMKKKNFR